MPKTAQLVLFPLIFLVFLIFGSDSASAQTVDINVTATVHGTSTCGDLICEGIENCNNCPADCGICPVPPPTGGDDYYVSPLTKVKFQGKAYPFANVFIQKNGAVTAVFKADSSGFFEKEISGVPAGTYVFSVFAEDKEERISAAVSFTTPVMENKTTVISRIFIPPTIEATPSQAERGQIIAVSGQTFPGSEINLFILSKNILHKTASASSGDWLLQMETLNLEEGYYTLRANSQDQDGEQSGYSKPEIISIIKSKCRGADLNFDGKVELVDFSILLYFWNQKNPSNRCADINSDGIVNIVDFSIMMYYWSK